MNRLALLALCSASLLPAAPLAALERERLLEHYRMTQSWLVSELAGLSEAQTQWRAAENKWSIADVVAHLAIAQAPILGPGEAVHGQAVEEGFKPKATDAGVLWYGIDRTQRNKTAEARTPHGEYKTAAAAHTAFSETPL